MKKKGGKTQEGGDSKGGHRIRCTWGRWGREGLCDLPSKGGGQTLQEEKGGKHSWAQSPQGKWTSQDRLYESVLKKRKILPKTFQGAKKNMVGAY